ncbi:hypothetical protein, conserved, partial [Plasmodium vivax]
YKFLGEIYKLYDDLDQSVVENHPNKDIINLCDNYDTFNVTFNQHQKSICKKILRNLFLCNSSNTDNFTNCCSNIYVWLNFELNKSKIANYIIENIFKLPKSRGNVGSIYYCPYFSFHDNMHNPENLMKLRIFNDNIDTFQNMLKDVQKSNDCSLKIFVYKCIEIYRDMYPKYCSNGKDREKKNKNSCEIINNFNTLYSSYINKENGTIHNFPELSSTTITNVIDGCSSHEYTGDSTFGESPQTGTSLTQNISRAFGAMAGIPPFLALIYK